MFEKLGKDVAQLRNEHLNSEERFHVLETLIDMKAQEKDVKLIKAQLEVLPHKDQITNMQTYMNKNVSEFAAQNKEFLLQFNEHLAIIRRYDEIISDKASKHSLYESETRLNG